MWSSVFLEFWGTGNLVCWDYGLLENWDSGFPAFWLPGLHYPEIILLDTRTCMSEYPHHYSIPENQTLQCPHLPP